VSSFTQLIKNVDNGVPINVHARSFSGAPANINDVQKNRLNMVGYSSEYIVAMVTLLV